MGQLAMLLRAKYLVPAISYPKVKGKPFKISELTAKINQVYED
jgi:2-oxoglutarate ferredoxin oxidoreductase subunit alpha